MNVLQPFKIPSSSHWLKEFFCVSARLILLTLCCVGVCNVCFSDTLSVHSKVSIITCGPGEELYEAYGHSAIRVSDPERNLDLVYNYGTFSFSDPDFYSKFIKGKLQYYLSVGSYDNFYASYAYDNRSLKEQVLNLSVEERNQVYQYLLNNHLLENRYYLYDFFYDNCATREIKLLNDVLGERLIWPVEEGGGKTFRQHIALPDFPWVYFGMSIALGTPTDKKTSAVEGAFLPYNLYHLIADSKVLISDSLAPLIRSSSDLFVPIPRETSANAFPSPVLFFWGLFALVLVVSALGIFKRRNFLLLFDYALFSISGLLGVLFLFLWFGTDHQSTAWNFNILWASPLNLIFPFLLQRHNAFKAYALFCFLSYTIVLLGSGTLVPQEFHQAVYPIVLILSVRVLAWVFFYPEICDRFRYKEINNKSTLLGRKA
ncbi:DUF4105 domain-containing protein [Cytophagaceae bacterium ABcell3]|nr:DUF4105 domain-containing protein [Cytophagaceae bacterium ABcell3]